MTFKDFNFNHKINEALHYMGFEKPTEIQIQSIPKILEGRDVLGSAQTGTGKTAAFVLPILNKLAEHPSENIDTLIIVPTRELALQIDQQIQGFSYFVEASSIALYGGGDGAEFHEQRLALKNGVNIIVATPGKLISHLNMGYVDLSKLKHLILDESDRMLDMGFYDDIKKIITYIPEKRQNLMFSATMPKHILTLTEHLLKNPFKIKIAISKPAEGVKQFKYEVNDNQKNALVIDIIKNRENYQSILIFTSTKKKVNEIVQSIAKKIKEVNGISSDLQQKEREDVLMNFRSKKTKILVATDLLSRGIDIKDIDLVINYDVPADAEDYVHRIGRTARAQRNGEAITFVNKDDLYKITRIERLIEKEVDKLELPEEIRKTSEFIKHTHSKPGFKKNDAKKAPFKPRFKKPNSESKDK